MSEHRLPIFFVSLLILAAALLLSGCGQMDPAPVEISTTPTPAEISEPPADAGYPAGPSPTPFDYTQDEGYPAPQVSSPTAELPEVLEIPEPGEDSGIVTGQLLSPGPGGTPYIGALYLANTIPSDQEGFPPIVSLSDQTDPLAVQDQTGRFLFTEITPGTYALVLWNPVASTVIEEPGTNEYMIFEVQPGEVTDLGIIGIP
jgi:hypothetical protein